MSLDKWWNVTKGEMWQKINSNKIWNVKKVKWNKRWNVTIGDKIKNVKKLLFYKGETTQRVKWDKIWNATNYKRW